MNEQNYTSLKLSKLLAEGGCELESEAWREHQAIVGESPFALVFSKPTKGVEMYPAYDILNDLCVKYAKEMFGENEGCSICLWGVSEMHGCIDEYKTAFEFHTKRILLLLQQGKKQEAEDYIWTHCLFNKKAD